MIHLIRITTLIGHKNIKEASGTKSLSGREALYADMDSLVLLAENRMLYVCKYWRKSGSERVGYGRYGIVRASPVPAS